MIYNFFDKAYVINLPEKGLRLKRISTRLKSLHIPFEIIRGVSAPSSNTLFHHEGHIGASLSHIKVWEDALKNGHNSFLIFEDDALLRDDSESILKKSLLQLPANWDLLFLGLNLLGKSIRNSQNIHSFDRGCHFHSYGVNAKSLTFIINEGKKIVKDIQNGGRGFIDSIIMSNRKLNKYHINPILSVQEPSFSSTGGGNRLNEYFKRFPKKDFVDNCQELKKWYSGAKDMYS